MSTSASGTITVTDAAKTALSASEAAPLFPLLTVVIADDGDIFASDLAQASVQSDGSFSLSYTADTGRSLFSRTMKVRVITRSGRQLATQSKPDTGADTLSFDPIPLRNVDITNWTVTLLGLGAKPAPVREGNAVRVLIDNQTCWAYLKDKLLAATTSINLMQLEFDMPPFFDPSISAEHPEIVLSFGSDVDPDNPRPVTKPDDYRPERILMAFAHSGKKVRLMMSTVDLNWAVLIADSFILLIILVPLLILLVLNFEHAWKIFSIMASSGPGGGLGSVQSYFKAANPAVATAGFPVSLYSRVHAKLALIDESLAFGIGSPFSQSYWDTHAHNVFEPCRGSASGEPIPVHDVSLAVRGPAVMDIQDAFRRHWNVAATRKVSGCSTQSGSTTLTCDTPALTADDAGRGVVGPGIPANTTIVSLQMAGSAATMSAAATATASSITVQIIENVPAILQPAAITTPDPDLTYDPEITKETIASLQLVRSINAGAFTDNDLKNGEQGILEAYLRAIEQATDYIYFENQYFTNEAIGNALVAALNDSTARPNLQVIVMINVTPDLPFYPLWQSNLIQRIRKGAGTNASRVGFFSAWSHNAADTKRGQSNPMVMANYLHTKAGIADGKWATVGSANLDGASLDFFQILHPLQFGDNRNEELNYVFFNGIDGHPVSPAPDAIDLLRRGLWSEHLGLAMSDAQLASTNSANFLTVWKSQAQKKKDSLTNNPSTPDPTAGRVLQWPAGLSLDQPWLFECLYQDPNPERFFLKSLQIPLKNLTLIDKTQSFDFFSGTWKK